jgi:hypothetical protein
MAKPPVRSVAEMGIVQEASILAMVGKACKRRKHCKRLKKMKKEREAEGNVGTLGVRIIVPSLHAERVFAGNGDAEILTSEEIVEVAAEVACESNEQ